MFSSVVLLSRSFRADDSLGDDMASLSLDDASTALDLLWGTPEDWGYVNEYACQLFYLNNLEQERLNYCANASKTNIF